MTATNTYATAAELKNHMGITEPIDDDVIDDVLNAASRQIDVRCDRHFWDDENVTTRVFRAEYGDLLEVDDISTATGLIVKTDEDGDGTYEITWTATDYQLEPFNAKRQGRAWPYTQIRVGARGVRSFPVASWAGVQVTARFGWPAVPDEIKEACLLQAARLFTRKDSPSGAIGAPDIGVIRVARFDADVESLVWPFVKIGVAAVG